MISFDSDGKLLRSFIKVDLYPPDKSGGYAQRTPTEFKEIDKKTNRIQDRNSE
jgi:hypothetical protein